MTKMFENAINSVRTNNGKRNGTIPGAYDISLEDFTALVEMAHSSDRNAQWKAIVLSFEFGFVMGNRCTIRRNMKRL